MNQKQLIKLGALAGSMAIAFSSAACEHHKAQAKAAAAAAYVEIEVADWFKSNAELEIKVPTSIAYGYEGYPQTPEQEKKAHEVADYLRNNAAALVSFPAALQCSYQIKTIKEFDEGMLEAKYELKCKEDLRGQNVAIDFSKQFQGIQNVNVKLEGHEKVQTTLAQSSGTVTIK